MALAGVAWGCGGGMQSALAPHGPSAAAVEGLWWLLLGVSVVVQVLVTAAVVAAIWPRDRPPSDVVLATGESTKRRVVAGAAGLTLLVLAGLVVASIVTDRSASRLPPPAAAALEVRVIAHQWWWELVYEDDEAPSRTFTTANELHVPVGRPVVIHLETRDVVHSFWVPNLAGKTDMVPGRRNTMWFQADTPGVYRGQCAEFCGLQHARMALLVVAEAPEQFEAWADAYRQPPFEPDSELARRGAAVFQEKQCALCHSIRGTPAGGRVAPDLSRIGARRTLAAASVPNGRGTMAAWILDPQHIKPGTFMPATAMDGDELHALLAYLERLQ